MRRSAFFFFLIVTGTILGAPPLPPIEVGTPRATMRTFLGAMNDYRAGVANDDPQLRARLDDALLCMDLSALEAANREAAGREAAMLLKETIDRIFSLNLQEIPNSAELHRWQVNDTAIALVRQDSGEQRGDYLFSSSTVARARTLYERVRNLPYQAGGTGAHYEEMKSRTQPGTTLLAPIQTETPRETMRTFLRAMNDYVQGVKSDDPKLRNRMKDAVQCLNLTDISPLLRDEKGEESAVLLKEVIDRVIYVDYSKIPDTQDDPAWRLKGTSIRISQVQEGERKGEYLFSADTVANIKNYYEIVKDQDYISGGKGALYREPWLEANVPAWARSKTLEVANWQWIGLFLAILIGLIIRTITAWLVLFAKKLADKSRTKWDDRIVMAIDRPIALLSASFFWFVAVYALRFSGNAQKILLIAVQVIFSLALIWLLFKLADLFTEYLKSLTDRTESTLDDHLVPLLKRALRIFVIVFGILVTVQNLGVNILSLLAGLGLGGLAFALAAKDMCANFFGSLMIFLDRPFQIGDWVVAGGTEGTVEEIGFRSTRIRTFYNSLISVPNSVLANANIDNMGRREYRRIKAHFGVTYDTPPERLEAFIEGIKNIVKANPFTRKDYFHVVFNSYGDFSLEVMLYCFLKVPDWSTELVERQNIYLEIHRLAHELNVEFAFPTQTLHMETFPEKKPVRGTAPVDREQLATTAAEFGGDGRLARPGGLGLFTPPYKE